MGFEWTQVFPNQSFDANIAKLKKFRQKHGHCNVTQQNKDDPSLGRWVRTMRSAFKQIQLGKNTRTKLTQSMIKQLEDLGFQWEIRNLSFATNITKLRNFKEKYGHCNVPNRYKEDPSLGHWVSDIRGAYKKIKLGKSTRMNLTQSKIDQLEEMGFEWDAINLSFDMHIAKLQKFKEKYGHFNVPRKYEDDPTLGSWVGTMRLQLGKSSRTNLTQANIKKLEEIGFSMPG